MYIFIHMYMCVYVNVCLYEYVYVNMYMSMSMYMCIQKLYIYNYMYICVRIHRYFEKMLEISRNRKMIHDCVPVHVCFVEVSICRPEPLKKSETHH